jgi:hypothetical protein
MRESIWMAIVITAASATALVGVCTEVTAGGGADRDSTEQGDSTANDSEPSATAVEPTVRAATPVDLTDASPDERLDPETFDSRYPWSWREAVSSDAWPGAAALDQLAEPPDGYERVSVSDGEFGELLRELPIRLDRRTVRSHDGRRLNSPSAGVALLPMLGGVQECADSIIRLYAEHLWREGRRSEIAFHFTSGDRSAWEDWVDGERFDISGSEVERRQGSPREPTRGVFREYLQHLFTYAGTMSLNHDARRLQPDEPTRPGDFFLQPGSPGHVVLVLDVAESDDGRRVALVGQGFIPAQEFHVVRDRGGATVDGLWFELPRESGETLDTPSWSAFTHGQRWRFE